ncbi:hypothetical protein ACLOJK_001115 [Asimina triloba]
MPNPRRSGNNPNDFVVFVFIAAVDRPHESQLVLEILLQQQASIDAARFAFRRTAARPTLLLLSFHVGLGAEPRAEGRDAKQWAGEAEQRDQDGRA